MPTCNHCGCRFRTLGGEEQDHECPKCGWAPWLEKIGVEEDAEYEDDTEPYWGL